MVLKDISYTIPLSKPYNKQIAVYLLILHISYLKKFDGVHGLIYFSRNNNNMGP
jgi:hypothetical protein